MSEAPKIVQDLARQLPDNFPAVISDTIFNGIEAKAKLLQSEWSE